MKLNWFLMKLYNIKVYFNKLKKKRFNGNLHVPVHSSLLEELVGLLICASYIARSASGLGQLQHPLAFSGKDPELESGFSNLITCSLRDR